MLTHAKYTHSIFIYTNKAIRIQITFKRSETKKCSAFTRCEIEINRKIGKSVFVRVFTSIKSCSLCNVVSIVNMRKNSITEFSYCYCISLSRCWRKVWDFFSFPFCMWFPIKSQKEVAISLLSSRFLTPFCWLLRRRVAAENWKFLHLSIILFNRVSFGSCAVLLHFFVYIFPIKYSKSFAQSFYWSESHSKYFECVGFFSFCCTPSSNSNRQGIKSFAKSFIKALCETTFFNLCARPLTDLLLNFSSKRHKKNGEKVEINLFLV